MSMTIKELTESVLITITETSLSGPIVDELKIEAIKFLDRGFNKITLDLSNTNYIDSSGIGKLLFINKKLSNSGGTMEIVNITPTLLDFFETLALNKIINIVQ